MLIQVNPHKIILTKTSDVNSGEYNVNECIFEFSQEFDNLTCIAVFSLCDGTTRNITILNNRCIIPTDVLQQTGQVKIGVYGYSVQDDELVLRYSPTPQIFVVTEGSYKEGTEPVAPSPTDWEILVEQVSDNSRDISNIQEDINNINTDIENIGTEIDDLDDKKANINDLASVAFSGSYTDLINKPDLSVYATKTDLSNEETARENADINLQNQIDAISVSSDVVDVVGTYQELVDYDTQHLKDNDIVKVLDDSTHNDALSYYRWDKETSTWSYVGSEGPFYTKGETNSLLNQKEDKITTTNKLDADLVDDSNSTNKFVTEEDITYWDNKEDKSNKVTEINSSSTDTQYPSAKCVYDSQVAQDTEIDTLKMIYNILPTDTDTGETISIDNTGEMPIKSISLGGNTSQEVISGETGTNVNATSISISDVNTSKEHYFELDGNTYQNSTTGKNVFDINETPSIIQNNTYSIANNKITFTNTAPTSSPFAGIEIPIKLKNNTQYTISFKVGKNSSISSMERTIYIIKKQATNTFATPPEFYCSSLSANTASENKTLTFTTTQEDYFIRLYAGTETESIANPNYYENIQIEESSTATSYEPYTNGASPNPDYPQDIEVVTGENDITIEGKNLVNIGTTTFEVSKTYDNLNIAPGTYTFSAEITSSDTDTSVSRAYFYNGNTNLGNAQLNRGTRSNAIITTTSPITKIILYASNTYNNSVGDTTTYKDVQLEKGSTATTYEPYVSQTYPINLGNIELCKIGTYQDNIYKQNDKWYLEKKTGKITLNGSEDWTFNSSQSTPTPRSIAYIYNYLSDYQQSYYSSHFIYGHTETSNRLVLGNSSNSHRWNMSLDDNITGIISTDTSVEKLNKIKNWFSNNNVLVYYVLLEATTTEITDSTLVSQLNALANSTLYSTTNINTETSNLLPYIDLQYNVVTPSPSPSRPSVVNVVKGNNTLTISNSDDTQSQTYQVNLPSNMELCKISTYQDYFYKDNGNWYLHSEVGKVMVNGSEDWNRTSIGGYSRFELDGVDYLKGTAATTTPNFISNYLIAKNFTEVANGNAGVSWWWNVSRKLLIIGLGDDRTLSDFKTWLSTHNTTVYYPLETPTNTQITDTTLITQLDNLQKAISYDTQTNISQTNEDKPFIITAEMFLSLKNVLN